MEGVIAQLLKRLDRKTIEFEVEEELRLHIELLGREYIRQGMSPGEGARSELAKHVRTCRSGVG
jgi:hypothetical protein